LRQDSWAYEVLEARKVVYVGRVVSVHADGGITVQVLKPLKGQPETLDFRHSDKTPNCSVAVSSGREYVFLPRVEGELQLCDLLPASGPMVKALSTMLRRKDRSKRQGRQ